MPTTGHCKLTLADGMILIAALAAWFALIRMTFPLGPAPPSVVNLLNLLILVVDSLAPLSGAWLAVRVMGVLSNFYLLTPWIWQLMSWR